MATKAQLEAELAELKRQMAERPDPEPEPAPSAEQPAEDGDALRRALTAQGLDEKDVDAALDWITREARDLSKNKPLLLGVGVLALGFILGRLTR